ncbi:MAG TPA: hypothetical protein VLK65_23860 [Vicinamibacteria bacterium]|nr:hypothetical protein [Vicinamibacteria bacterium]
MVSGEAPANRPWRTAFLATALAIVLLTYLLRLGFLERRGFNPDELQHLHSSWCISQGLLPYRDYFDHHTPWLHFGLSVLFSYFDVTTDPEEAISLIFSARRAMWVATGLILALTFWVGRQQRGVDVGLLAVLLLSNTLMFLGKTLEIRPDVPASALLVLAVALSSGALRAPPPHRARWRIASSGLALGAAVMFTQKALFVLPGFVAALALHLWEGGKSRLNEASRDVYSLAGGFLLPILGTLSFFAIEGALSDFVELSFLINLRWKARLSAWPLFEELTVQNPFLVSLGAVGFGKAAVALCRQRPPRSATALPLFAASSLVLGAFLIPAPHRHYALAFLPFAAVYASMGLWDIVDAGSSRSDRVYLVLAVLGVSAALVVSRPSFEQAWVYPALWLGGGAAFFVLLRRGSRHGAAAILLITLSLHPLYQSRVFWERRNWSTLQAIEWILRNVGPDETVLDGFSGLGVFRRHAFFFFFLHDEIRPMLRDDDWRELIRGLESGSIAPKVVVFDRHLEQGPAELREVIERNYLPAEPEPVRVRFIQESWRDAGPRVLGQRSSPLPYVLVEEGWYAPEEEGGIEFRRSRGKRCRLRVPIAEPADLEAIIRGRAEMTADDVTIELAVNGASVGELELVSGWRDYAFSIPKSRLKPGLNDFLLTYSQTPRQLDPNLPDRNTVLAVHSLSLQLP